MSVPINHSAAELTRRRFLGQTAAGVVAGWTAAPSPAMVSANDRVRIGVVGVGRRGTELMLALARDPGAEIVAVSDVDPLQRRQALHELGAIQSRTPRVVADARRLFDEGRLDAVVIATPDYTHVPLAIAACAAGKDVYLETPATHSRTEAFTLLHAAEGRIVQCGLQERSGEHFRSAVERLRGGEIGQIGLVRAWGVHRRNSGDAAKNTAYATTAVVDGTSPLPTEPQPTSEIRRRSGEWRWSWETGSGELGHLGVHLLDVARWGVGVEMPLRVTAQGMKLRDDLPGETPDTLSVQYEYERVTVLWEHRTWSDYGVEGRSAGVAFHGTNGTLVLDRGGWKVYGRKPGTAAPGSPLLEPHLADFLNAVRTRQTPAADLRTGCLSSALCHLGNEVYRSGREWRAADA